MAELSANGGETSRSNLRPLKIQTPAGWLNPGTRLRTVLGERLSMIDLSAQPAWVKDLRLIWDSTKEANEGAPRTPVMEEEEEEEEEGRRVSRANVADGAIRTLSTEKF